MNYKFTTYQDDNINMTYLAAKKSIPLKVKDYGIKKVSIVMNFAQVREQDDSNLKVIDTYNKNQ